MPSTCFNARLVMLRPSLAGNILGRQSSQRVFMLGKFWNRSGSTGSKRLDAVDSRGLEVVDDDPETSWSLWDNALADQESRYGALPPVSEPAPFAKAAKAREHRHDKVETADSTFNFNFDEIPTRPMELHELTDEQRMTHALEIVARFHQRVATTIRTFWGHDECPLYINKLILEGHDGSGEARSGFNALAVQAMMNLVDLHEVRFGPLQQHTTIWD